MWIGLLGPEGVEPSLDRTNYFRLNITGHKWVARIKDGHIVFHNGQPIEWAAACSDWGLITTMALYQALSDKTPGRIVQLTKHVAVHATDRMVVACGELVITCLSPEPKSSWERLLGSGV